MPVVLLISNLYSKNSYNFMNTLYIVATPIGNLEDITYRAVRILKEVPLILAEDTRHSRLLLEHYSISTPMESYHDFNKEKVTPKYIDYLKTKGDIALISDAGTPGIADPAFNLVRECVRENIEVRAIPGPSAMITALISCGMPTDRFRFENFSPKKSAQRLHLLERLKENADSTLIFYVSPHHLVKFLEEIKTVFGEIPLALMRELTKKFEEHLIQTPSALLAHYKERTPKGEYVLIFHPQGKGGL
jgi:16S rRNA (cytidine1402-2'-O)-methyltransferase